MKTQLVLAHLDEVDKKTPDRLSMSLHGVSQILQKPFNAASLKSAMAESLGGKR